MFSSAFSVILCRSKLSLQQSKAFRNAEVNLVITQKCFPFFLMLCALILIGCQQCLFQGGGSANRTSRLRIQAGKRQKIKRGWPPPAVFELFTTIYYKKIFSPPQTLPSDLPHDARHAWVQPEDSSSLYALLCRGQRSSWEETAGTQVLCFFSACN